jgi:polar amino acid transport system permease protein
LPREGVVGAATTPSPHPPLRRTGMSPRRRAQLIRYAVYALTVAVLAFIVVKADWAKIQQAFFDPEVFADLFPEIITTAARNTIIFTTLGFTGGLIIGLVLALMRLSSIRPYRWAAAVYIEIFRGVPALVTLILIGYALPIALQVKVPGDYGPGSLALAIVAGAYMAETIRAGIEAVPRGQMEAARSLGMGYGRSMVSIIIPQAFRVILPPLTNELVLLIKDTSLLFVLGTTSQTLELAKYGRDAMSDSFNGTPIVAVAIVYLAITLPLTQVVAVLERRNRRSR